MRQAPQAAPQVPHQPRVAARRRRFASATPCSLHTRQPHRCPAFKPLVTLPVGLQPGQLCDHGCRGCSRHDRLRRRWSRLRQHRVRVWLAERVPSNCISRHIQPTAKAIALSVQDAHLGSKDIISEAHPMCGDACLLRMGGTCALSVGFSALRYCVPHPAILHTHSKRFLTALLSLFFTIEGISRHGKGTQSVSKGCHYTCKTKAGMSAPPAPAPLQ